MFREPVNYCTDSWDFWSISTLIALGSKSLYSVFTGVTAGANTASDFSRTTHVEVRQSKESEGVRRYP